MSKIKIVDRLATDAEIIKMTKQCVLNGSAKLYDLFPELIAVVIKERLWQQELDKSKKPFKTFWEFVFHPLWQGLAIESMDRLLDYCKHNKTALQMVRAEIPPLLEHKGTGSNQFKTKENSRGSHTTSAKKPLRGSAYFIARLKRDHPLIATKLDNGEYRSVRQAAIAAGIITVKTPLEKIQIELKKLTIAECTSAEQSIEKIKHTHVQQKKYKQIIKKPR